MEAIVVNRILSIAFTFGVIFLCNQKVFGEESMINKFIFSDVNYEKNIDTEFHVVTAEIAAELILLESPPSKIPTFTYENVRNEELYLFLALKNNGNKSPWGTLIFQAPLKNRKIHIYSIYRDMWSYFIIPLGKVRTEQDLKKITEGKLKWERLYSK